MMKGAVYYENAELGTRPDIINSGRPVVIVTENPTRNVVQVVPLTSNIDKLRSGDPMHVAVSVCGNLSVALCEQLRTVHSNELRRFPIHVCSEDEIEQINAALQELLGLNHTKEVHHEHE